MSLIDKHSKELEFQTEYTDVSLNPGNPPKSTTVYDTGSDARVTGVFMQNSGTTATFRLEVKDQNGNNTTVIADKGSGSNLEVSNGFLMSKNDKLVITVDTAEGSSLTETCAVFRAEK